MNYKEKFEDFLNRMTGLLDFPMDAEIRVDMHPKYSLSIPAAVGWDDDHKRVWITNYP